jgi:hypothetical protein
MDKEERKKWREGSREGRYAAMKYLKQYTFHSWELKMKVGRTSTHSFNVLAVHD